MRAVLPLLIKKGTSTTTADMAAAAGIAEGTIFRVFEDKQAILHEAIRITLEPSSTEAAINTIDPELPLDAQLTEAAEILTERFDKITALMEVMHTMPQRARGRGGEGRKMFIMATEAVTAAIDRLFDRSSEQLSTSPALAANAFRALIFANAHPMTSQARTATTHELVSILLSGIAISKES